VPGIVAAPRIYNSWGNFFEQFSLVTGPAIIWVISNTTKDPTTSEFLQLFRTSAKCFQSAFFAILYRAFREALHSLCLAAACRIAFRLTTRMTDLRIMRKLVATGEIDILGRSECVLCITEVLPAPLLFNFLLSTVNPCGVFLFSIF